MSIKMSLREIIAAILNEIKAALKEYANEAQTALKVRLKKILTITIIGAVLLALAITFAASASLFILIGALRYLETFLPPWQAWLTIGATAALIATALFAALYAVIRKQLATPKTPPQQSQTTQTQKNSTEPTQNKENDQQKKQA